MILRAILILGGVGVTFAILIALAYRKLRVWEDPRIDVVAGLLPNANCGACGLPGCRAFAEQVVEGKIQPAKCTVSSESGVLAIANYLGVDRGTAVKRVARLQCAGGTDVAVQQAEYRGLSSCAAAAAVAGGGKGCAWGCLGFADCVVSCDFDAIHMNEFSMPVVDIDKCTACGDCVEACPKDLFVLQPVNHHLFVQCRNLVAGDEVLEQCRVACTACGRCVQDSAPGFISVNSGVAVIDYAHAELEDPRAIARCPTNSIVWLEGVQFATSAKSASAPVRRSAVA
jgi:Na+-translocating ferredoxin:NAD+ oxidoreductase RNF subunit RnfB